MSCERSRALRAQTPKLWHSPPPFFLPLPLWVYCAGVPTPTTTPLLKTPGGAEEGTLADKEARWKMLPPNPFVVWSVCQKAHFHPDCVGGESHYGFLISLLSCCATATVPFAM